MVTPALPLPLRMVTIESACSGVTCWSVSPCSTSVGCFTRLRAAEGSVFMKKPIQLFVAARESRPFGTVRRIESRWLSVICMADLIAFSFWNSRMRRPL